MKMKCFVVQGFGTKTDLANGRMINLDASYSVIKQAVEAAGLECVRADEIIHSGTIDIPMYEQLLRADLVIADLSTYNVNAAFELGVRYGLRPRSTIVVAESEFKSPFDVNHIVIRRYKHLGEDVGAQEAKRFAADLTQAIQKILKEGRVDSPVYSMLALRPPLESNAPSAPAAAPAAAAAPGTASGSAVPPGPSPRRRVTRGIGGSSEGSTTGFGTSPMPSPSRGLHDTLQRSMPVSAAPAAGSEVPKESARTLMERARAAIKASDFVEARANLQELLKLNPQDPHVLQQLALATYKSKQPTAEQALQDAHAILVRLSPETTNDPETLGLWGAVHKKVWDLQKLPECLDLSISAYQRGFLLRQDYYNGINLAYLLDVRAVESAKAGSFEEAIADSVTARKVRKDVIRYVSPRLQEDIGDETRFWMLATLWEAALGLGDEAAMARWTKDLEAMTVPQWMRESQQHQGARLRQVLAEWQTLSPSTVGPGN